MAGSIQLFQFFQKCHQTFGIHSCQSNQNQHHWLNTNLIQPIFLISCAQFLLTTIAFFSFEAKSMFEYGIAFYSLVTITMCIAVYLILICQSENTLKYIENCEGFIEKRTHSRVAYNELIGKIELFNQFLSFGMGFTILFLLTVGPWSFVRYYIFNMEEDSFYLLFPVWFPFNWKTPFGYLVAWLAQAAAGTAIGGMLSQFLNVVFGSCWLFIFIADDITRDVAAFNITAKATSDGNRSELRKCFCDMVQIYSDAKERVMEFNHVFKYSLFAFISWDMLSVSSLLVTVQFELWSDDAKFFEIVLLIDVLVWITSIIFLLCEPGERITNQFRDFSDELSRCDWYLLPMELQRWYMIFLSDTQSPTNVFSYANITCERETSKKMINTAFSYFMTFRRFKP